jgi:hypothetical protein
LNTALHLIDITIIFNRSDYFTANIFAWVAKDICGGKRCWGQQVKTEGHGEGGT